MDEQLWTGKFWKRYNFCCISTWSSCGKNILNRVLYLRSCFERKYRLPGPLLGNSLKYMSELCPFVDLNILLAFKTFDPEKYGYGLLPKKKELFTD